ncbi:VCBS domain-containing protein [Pseudoalteromonas haloplanktis]|uniref:VCBS domain-containing protein n=1 Tax=Pseudoalteromonas haloplanktis TaxID=228 RepID=A0ABU1BAA9_PSEHA|nr:VCBS domain-containing protein [Pseudoalteromonas haloplanktis]MDQ9091440.1 VCBS domain-containing protein [Pseudoalteromonas haloplanktis]
MFYVSVLLSALAGCGSSDTKSTADTAIAKQDPAVISGEKIGKLNNTTVLNINGKLNITDVQSGEDFFNVQTNTPSSYGFFNLDEEGNWSYFVDVDNHDISTLAKGQLLEDVVTVTAIDGTTAQITITIEGGDRDALMGFIAISEVVLKSDGVDQGADAYTLIENVFAKGSIESPDMYEGNHQGVLHIIEDTDTTVGSHFVFLAHRDDDQDKDSGPSDRQRNEIKAYDKSPDSTLAYKDETFQYSWKFKVSSELELTSKFSHFFQIKARNESNDNTNGNDDQPIITLSGAQKNSTGNQLQVRYSAGFDESGKSTGLDKNLIETDWSLITDEWVEVFVQATFSENGQFAMTLTRLSDKQEIFNIHEQNIDMWRGFSEKDFARPKWGIYRSIVETDSLRADEEQVRFADFSIKKGTLSAE